MCKKRHFQFQLCHQVTLLKFEPTFPIYGPLVQEVSFRFLLRCVLTNFTKIWLHLYHVSLKWHHLRDTAHKEFKFLREPQRGLKTMHKTIMDAYSEPTAVLDHETHGSIFTIKTTILVRIKGNFGVTWMEIFNLDSSEDFWQSRSKTENHCNCCAAVKDPR